MARRAVLHAIVSWPKNVLWHVGGLLGDKYAPDAFGPDPAATCSVLSTSALGACVRATNVPLVKKNELRFVGIADFRRDEQLDSSQNGRWHGALARSSVCQPGEGY
jgi:hypothetical protein